MSTFPLSAPRIVSLLCFMMPARIIYVSSEKRKHENDVTSKRTIDWLVFSRASAFFSPFSVPLLSPEQQSHALFIIQTIYGFSFYSLVEISRFSAPSAADCRRLAWLVIEGKQTFQSTCAVWSNKARDYGGDYGWDLCRECAELKNHLKLVIKTPFLMIINFFIITRSACWKYN